MTRYNLRIQWIGPHDPDGFVEYGRIYIAEKSAKTDHYFFINSYSQRDMAHVKWFKIVKTKEIRK